MDDLENWHSYQHVMKHLGWTVLALSRGDNLGQSTLRSYYISAGKLVATLPRNTKFADDLQAIGGFLIQAFNMPTSTSPLATRTYKSFVPLLDYQNEVGIASTLPGLVKWHNHVFKHLGRAVVAMYKNDDASKMMFQTYLQGLGVLYQSLTLREPQMRCKDAAEDLRKMALNVLVLIACLTGKKLSKLDKAPSFTQLSRPKPEPQREPSIPVLRNAVEEAAMDLRMENWGKSALANLDQTRF